MTKIDYSKWMTSKDIDRDFYVKEAETDKNLRLELINGLINESHILIYYRCYEILDIATKSNPGLYYEYWDNFSALLKHKNSYHRNAGLAFIGHLSKNDKDKKFSKIYSEFITFLYDEKVLTRMYCINSCNEIIKNGTKFKKEIVNEVINLKGKEDKNKALIEYSVLELIDNNYLEINDGKIISEYVIKRGNSISPKTKKKAKEMITKYNLK